MTARTIGTLCPRCRTQIALPRSPETVDDIRCPLCRDNIHLLGSECPACLVEDPSLHTFWLNGGWWKSYDDTQDAFDAEYRRRKEQELAI